MSDLKKTNVQSNCSINNSIQKSINNNSLDTWTGSENSNDNQSMSMDFDIDNKNDTKYAKSDSDLSDKIDIVEDQEMLDIIEQVNQYAKNFIPKLTEMIDDSEMTFVDLEKICSAHIKKLMMKTFDKNRKLDKNRKFNWKLFQAHEEKMNKKLNFFSKQIIHLNGIVRKHQDDLVKIGPHVKPHNVIRVAGTQHKSKMNDTPPEGDILQLPNTSPSTSNIGSKLQGVKHLSPSNIIDISSDDESNNDTSNVDIIQS